MDMTNLVDALTFIVGGGSSVIVGAALSYLVENWTAWHNLPRWLKFILPMLASAGLAIGAQVLMGYADIVEQVAPWYTIIAVAITTWINTQKAYANAKASGYGVDKPAG